MRRFLKGSYNFSDCYIEIVQIIWFWIISRYPCQREVSEQKSYRSPTYIHTSFGVDVGEMSTTKKVIKTFPTFNLKEFSNLFLLDFLNLFHPFFPIIFPKVFSTILPFLIIFISYYFYLNSFFFSKLDLFKRFYNTVFIDCFYYLCYISNLNLHNFKEIKPQTKILMRKSLKFTK